MVGDGSEARSNRGSAMNTQRMGRRRRPQAYSASNRGMECRWKGGEVWRIAKEFLLPWWMVSGVGVMLVLVGMCAYFGNVELEPMLDAGSLQEGNTPDEGWLAASSFADIAHDIMDQVVGSGDAHGGGDGFFHGIGDVGVSEIPFDRRLSVDKVDWSKMEVEDISEPPEEPSDGHYASPAVAGGYGGRSGKKKKGKGQKETVVFLAGIIRDLSTMTDENFKEVIKLNCVHGFGVHLVTREDSAKCREMRQIHLDKIFGEDARLKCGPFLVLQEPDDLTHSPNRVDRIAFLRDLQRTHLNSALGEKDLEKRVIILADFDLYRFPPSKVTLREVNKMMSSQYHDVVCAAGTMHRPPGYYDIFATVFLPSTFAYPVAGRLIGKPSPGEDLGLIRSDDIYGHITQSRLMDHFNGQAEQSESGCVPVRSCFGGFTLYRASTFFTPTCRYVLDTEKYLMQFANKEDGRPCEHVVFHDCLLREAPGATIAVQPQLESKWDAPYVDGEVVRSNGRIQDGLIGEGAEHMGLVAAAGRPAEGNALVNGDFRLRIDNMGSLVVERMNDGQIAEIVWEAEVYSYYFDPRWTYMFLLLTPDGLLVLVQQTDAIGGLCDVSFDLKRSCRTVVWTSGTRDESGRANEYILSVSDEGWIDVRNRESNSVLWSSRDDLVIKKRQEISAGQNGCLNGGDQDTINAALTSPDTSVVLCQRAVFTLSKPVKYNLDGQKVFTEGDPDDDRRAVLKICSPYATTAVVMTDISFVELRSVIIDGCSKEMEGGGPEALLIMGGSGASTQRLARVHAFNARGGLLIHLHEGDPSDHCRRPLLEDNEIGPSGKDGHGVSGVAVACRETTMRRNYIHDLTATAIAIFCAPGSLIENNVIESKKVHLGCGISMVDYVPYYGDYTDTVVRRNRISATDATIGVAFSMGRWMTKCFDADEAKKTTNLYGALVTENVLAGPHMGYGFIVDGVDTWLVAGNMDETGGHVGINKFQTCKVGPVSLPDGFLVNRKRATGAFQDEFLDANIENGMSGWTRY